MQNSKFRGLTLIELLVVMTLMAILSLSSVFVFSSYSKAQALQTGVADFLDLVNKGRDRAITHVKPAVCAGESLEGYQIWVPVPGRYSRLSVRCSGNYHILERRSLPTNVTFASGTTSTTFFNVSSGVVSSNSTYIIQGPSSSKTVTIDTIGNIAVH